jgi:long-chain acyl-CoA synthetase
MRPHLATLLDDFRRFGNEKAIVRYTGNRRRTSTYAQIASQAGRFAALLIKRNIASGDRVILWAENSAEWIAAFYGCMLRGVIAVPLDAYGAPEFAARVAANVRPSLIAGDTQLLRTLQGEWPTLSFDDWPAALPTGEAAPIADLSHDTPLQILFTSGTTGDPKGIVHTHGNVLSSIEPIRQQAQAYLRYERLVHPLRFLHTLPLSHVFGQTMGLWIPPIFSAEVHFASHLTAPRLIETIHRERISVLAAVPRVLAILKNHLETEYPNLPARLAAAQKLSALKRWWSFRDIHAAFGLKFWAFITGGGALPAPVEHFWNTLGFVLVQGYGMTETAALITLNHPFRVAQGTMGKPLPGREVKLQPDGEVLVRGPMISTAAWSQGALHPRASEWLATGDLAEAQPTGELRFLGRKSEIIVTGSGVNLHPEDLEAALEQEPEVAACAVVPIETPSGPEPCAVLALRGTPNLVSDILQRANTRLAEFQRIRRWELWPDPDLPRTSTGKVKRAAITAWLAERKPQAERSAPAAGTDWLLALIAHITGEDPPDDHETRTSNRDLRLAEDLHLDSLGRIQLLEALEERFGEPIEEEEYTKAQTLSEVRQLVMAPTRTDTISSHPHTQTKLTPSPGDSAPTSTSTQTSGIPHPARHEPQPRTQTVTTTEPRTEATLQLQSQPQAQATLHSQSAPTNRYLYPHWPWLAPFRWLRTAFVEYAMRPLVWLLAAPRIARAPLPQPLPTDGPMLIIANHVTAYDVPLLLFALPRAIRTHTAVAMSGEMLEDLRHARNQQPRWLNPLGPPVWLLLTALFNVFPLPRQRNFQRSFSHAGEALDHGFHVIVFPEGTRSPDGALANFRPGIGLLVKQSFAAVLPIALYGLGDLKTRQRSWFRSGTLEVRLGHPLRFTPNDSESTITTHLQAKVEKLLAPQSNKDHPS